MPGSRDFGKIINERRLSLGYSLGQLANRMGTTATKVRSWERGDALPDEATLDQLAEELNVSAGVLRATLPATEPLLEDSGAEPTAAVAGPMFSDGADTASAEVEDQHEVEDEHPGDSPDEPADRDSADDQSDAPEPTALVAATDLDGGDDAAADGPARADGSHDDDMDLVDLPTEAVAVVPSIPAFETSGGLVPAAALATAPPRVRIDPNEIPIPEPSGFFAPVERLMANVFNPDKRYLFWIRIALIALIFFVFLRVLAWAVPEFFDTLKDILDTIESTPTEPDPGTDFISG